jgi:hypothetical protein
MSATRSVYWVRDEQTAERLKRAPDYPGEVCYTLAELRELSGQSPELLRDIHPLKGAFGATVQKTTKEAGHAGEIEDIEMADTKVGALVSAEGKTTT